jgi:hypothetical protein
MVTGNAITLVKSSPFDLKEFIKAMKSGKSQSSNSSMSAVYTARLLINLFFFIL